MDSRELSEKIKKYEIEETSIEREIATKKSLCEELLYRKWEGISFSSIDEFEKNYNTSKIVGIVIIPISLIFSFILLYFISQQLQGLSGIVTIIFYIFLFLPLILSYIYIVLKEKNKILNYHSLSQEIKISEKRLENIIRNKIKLKIGLYIHSKNYNKAAELYESISYFQKAAELYEKGGDSWKASDIYLEMKNYDKLYELLGTKREGWNYLAEVFEKEGLWDKAKNIRETKIEKNIVNIIDNNNNSILTNNRIPISNKLKHEIWRRDKFTCQYCGKDIDEVDLEIDHIKPVAKGGTNAVSNLQTLCFDCNRSKGAK